MPLRRRIRSPKRSPSLSPIDARVAATLFRRRHELGLVPELIDIAIGEPHGTVDSFERGRLGIGAAQLFRLAGVLDMDVADFFSEDAEKQGLPPRSRHKPNSKKMSEARNFVQAYCSVGNKAAREKVKALIDALTDPNADAVGSDSRLEKTGRNEKPSS